MSNAFVIEVRSYAAGIVVRDGRHYRFFAAAREFNDLEGREFRSPAAAQKAVLGLAAMLDSGGDDDGDAARRRSVRH